MKVSFYASGSGRSPVVDHIHALDKPERARVLAVLDQVERFGVDAAGATFRQIEGKLWEIKISATRVFYVVVRAKEIVLLHAYKKQGQKLPPRERDVALRRMKEVLR